MPEHDAGDTSALLCAFFHIPPWDQPNLTDEQVEMLMSRLGLVRLFRDLPQLEYTFSKMSTEDCEKLIESDERRKAAQRAGKTAPLTAEERTRSKAWSIILSTKYGIVDDEKAPEHAPLDISAEAARGILADLEDDLLSDTTWERLLAGGTYRRVVATAGG